MNKTFDTGQQRKLLYAAGKALGVITVLVLLMLWLSGAFISKVEPGPPTPKSKPKPFRTAKVENLTFPQIVEQVGTVRAQTQAQVSARIMAQVREILVTEGDNVIGTVDESTVLARLDDREIQAKLRQAESQVKAMEQALQAAMDKVGAARAQVSSLLANRQKVASDYLRYQDLHKHRAATGQQLDHARAQKDMVEAQLLAARKEANAAESEVKRIKAQIEQAEAAAAEARVMLGYTVIRAPFTGQVVQKMVDEGDMAIPGQPLFFLQTSSRPVLHAYVAESYLPHLKIGQDLKIQIDALAETVTGKISEIVPQADPATRTVLVKVSMEPKPELVNGLFGRLLVPYGSYQALVAPAEAVRQVGQLNLVDVVDAEGYPVRRFVTLGKHHDGLVEILSGLEENEEVVIP
ncbi:MAG: efflux RND transporter periplasmic adaptor subunit [Desulfoferrobacter sp.]